MSMMVKIHTSGYYIRADDIVKIHPDKDQSATGVDTMVWTNDGWLPSDMEPQEIVEQMQPTNKEVI